MGIEVDDERPVASESKGGGEVDSVRRLPHAPLLISDRDYRPQSLPRHSLLPPVSPSLPTNIANPGVPAGRHARTPGFAPQRGFTSLLSAQVAPQGTIGIYTARTALLATTWDRSAVSAFGRHQGVSYPQALGNKGLGTGTASDQQVRPTPMQVGTTAARPVPPRSCGENRCVDTNGARPRRGTGARS